MKKIGLVTWLGSGNYGTCLQAIALHYYLESKGYKVHFTSSFPNTKGVKPYVKFFLYLIGVLQLRSKILQKKSSYKAQKLERVKVNFINTPILFTDFLQRRYVKNTDVFLTGSDQIWNTYNHFDPFMFLDFAKINRKVAYASSIGTNSVKEEYKEYVKELLMKFDHIGVREQTAVKVLSELTGRKDIVQVLDPTFLLKPQDWKEVISKTKVDIEIPNEYIICYLIGANDWYRDQLEQLKKITGINNIIIISSVENPEFTIPGAIVYDSADPLEFVKLIEQASFVCTDSFHATVISINFQKDFVEFMRFKDTQKESQNSRIYDVLTHYGLMDRIYNGDSTKWASPIDCTKAQNILKQDREFSETYLLNAIEGK